MPAVRQARPEPNADIATWPFEAPPKEDDSVVIRLQDHDGGGMRGGRCCPGRAHGDQRALLSSPLLLRRAMPPREQNDC